MVYIWCSRPRVFISRIFLQSDYGRFSFVIIDWIYRLFLQSPSPPLFPSSTRVPYFTLLHRISSFPGLFSTFYHLRSPHLIDYVFWIGKTFTFFCCCLYSRRYFIRPNVSTKPLLMNCYFTGFLHFTDSQSLIFILPRRFNYVTTSFPVSSDPRSSREDFDFLTSSFSFVFRSIFRLLFFSLLFLRVFFISYDVSIAYVFGCQGRFFLSIIYLTTVYRLVTIS